MDDTDKDLTLLRERVTAQAMEKRRAAQASRYAIVCSAADAEMYFYDAMTPEERRAVACALVELGKATWAHSDTWVR